jgi:hypothetical protein
MSKPIIKATLYNTIMEIGGTSSSLHCPPDPIKSPSQDAYFLTELDNTAQHAATHLSAAGCSVSQVLDEMRELHDRLHYAAYHENQDHKKALKEVRQQLSKWMGYRQ